MKKNKYLANPNVKAFSTWLAKSLSDNTFATSYFNKEPRKKKVLKAYSMLTEKYQWPYPQIAGLEHPPPSFDFSANMVALNHLRNNLVSALNRRLIAIPQCEISAIDVMTWGGVRPGNVMSLTNHHTGLRDIVATMRESHQRGGY